MGFLFSGCPTFKGAVNTVDSQTFWNRPTSEGHSALGGRGDRGGGARVWEAPWGCVGAQKGPHLRGSLRLDSSLCSGCSPRSQGSPTVGGRPSWRSDCTKPAGFALWFLMEPAAESPGHGDPDSKGPRVGSMKVWFQPPCGCRSLQQVAWAWGWCRPWWWLRGQEPTGLGSPGFGCGDHTSGAWREQSAWSYGPREHILFAPQSPADIKREVPLHYSFRTPSTAHSPSTK